MTDDTVQAGQGDLFIVSSPSGGGKTTIINRTMESFRRRGVEFHFSVSHTTRPPRSGEVDGRDYHFVSRETFDRMIGADEFLEHAVVHGNFYGTARRAVAEATGRGIDVILDIDVQGARKVKTNWRGRPPVKIFVFPPSYEELRRRLQLRRTDEQEVIERRLRNAGAEFAEYGEYDHVIINDDLDRAVTELEAILTAARLRPDRQKDRLDRIVREFRGRETTKAGGSPEMADKEQSE
jgi:guanylate kinase